MKWLCIMKPWKNLILPARQLSQERDGVQPSTSSGSPQGNTACHRARFYHFLPLQSVPRTFFPHLWKGFVLSDKHWAEPYVSWVALCNKGGWVSIYCSTCESFPFWPDLKRWDWITLHLISDWHWMLKIYCSCRHRFVVFFFFFSFSAEGILIFPEFSRSTWACQCQFLLYKQLLDPKADFTVLFPCKCHMQFWENAQMYPILINSPVH